MVKFISCIFITTFFLSSCSAFESVQSPANRNHTIHSANDFVHPGQLTASENILYADISPTGRPGAAPILELNREETLTVLFETAGFESGQFVISFTHHNPDWSLSPIPPEFFMVGLYEAYVSGGEVNRSDAFRYRQFTYEFPNRDLQFEISGNYMLRVEDSVTGRLVFTLPFFLHENRGNIRASVQTDFTGNNGRRILHRPVAQYNSPDFATMPQFDLLFLFAQNSFWGRTKIASETDFSDHGNIRFELDAQSAFYGNYEFRTLNLGNLSQLNPDIDEIKPAENPVSILLDEDIDGLAGESQLLQEGTQIGPVQNLSSRYARARFRLETDQPFSENENIYLTGDFNNWRITDNLKLDEQDEAGYRSIDTLLKQGMYRYKYIVFDGQTVDDTRFDSGFSDTIQEYHAFVYFRDPETRAFRLLQVLQFYGR